MFDISLIRIAFKLFLGTRPLRRITVPMFTDRTLYSMDMVNICN